MARGTRSVVCASEKSVEMSADRLTVVTFGDTQRICDTP